MYDLVVTDVSIDDQWPLLLTGINFIPIMDK